MLKLYLYWFLFFIKFKSMQFIISNEYSRIAAPILLNSIDSRSLIPLPLKNNGLVPFYTIFNDTVMLNNNFKMGSEHRIRHHKKRIYSEWSDWSPCSANCITIRKRHCIRPRICKSNIVTESLYCFTKGSECLGLLANYKLPSKLRFPNQDNRYVPMNLTCGVTVDLATTAFKTPRYLTKITGGQESKKFYWPWQVAVLNELKELICGGTLVAPGWVLTAAHCSRKKLYVRLSEYDLSIYEGDEFDLRVKHVILHPSYNPNTVDNDLALLRLHTFDFEINDNHYNMQPACLPVSDFQLRKRKPVMCVILGWGKVRSKNSYGSQVLREARVPIVGQRTCRDAYRRYLITDNMFCAGYRDGRSDTCSGDSGGPLLCLMRGRWTVVGVTSFGDGCGRRGKYGIYASVANQVPWITSTITKYGYYQ